MNCVNEACVTTAAELEELKVCLARKQVSICAYCGHVAHREGRPEQEFQEELYAHILNCEKRPEHERRRIGGVGTVSLRRVQVVGPPRQWHQRGGRRHRDRCRPPHRTPDRCPPSGPQKADGRR